MATSPSTPVEPGAARGAPDEEEVVDRIRALLDEHPDVAGAHGGRLGDIAAHLPGRRVAGVRFSDERVEIGVAARWSRPLPALVEELRAAVLDVLTRAGSSVRTVDVTVADIEPPDG
ncbi:hypothetical protein GCM10027174_23450 [Salinifilum aidingensis]